VDPRAGLDDNRTKIKSVFRPNRHFEFGPLLRALLFSFTSNTKRRASIQSTRAVYLCSEFTEYTTMLLEYSLVHIPGLRQLKSTWVSLNNSLDNLQDKAKT
jgi:hypothetical protein